MCCNVIFWWCPFPIIVNGEFLWWGYGRSSHYRTWIEWPRWMQARHTKCIWMWYGGFHCEKMITNETWSEIGQHHLSRYENQFSMDFGSKTRLVTWTYPYPQCCKWFVSTMGEFTKRVLKFTAGLRKNQISMWFLWYFGISMFFLWKLSGIPMGFPQMAGPPVLIHFNTFPVLRGCLMNHQWNGVPHHVTSWKSTSEMVKSCSENHRPDANNMAL